MSDDTGEVDISSILSSFNDTIKNVEGTGGNVTKDGTTSCDVHAKLLLYMSMLNT